MQMPKDAPRHFEQQLEEQEQQDRNGIGGLLAGEAKSLSTSSWHPGMPLSQTEDATEVAPNTEVHSRRGDRRLNGLSHCCCCHRSSSRTGAVTATAAVMCRVTTSAPCSALHSFRTVAPCQNHYPLLLGLCHVV